MTNRVSFCCRRKNVKFRSETKPGWNCLNRRHYFIYSHFFHQGKHFYKGNKMWNHWNQADFSSQREVMFSFFSSSESPLNDTIIISVRLCIGNDFSICSSYHADEWRCGSADSLKNHLTLQFCRHLDKIATLTARERYAPPSAVTTGAAWNKFFFIFLSASSV